jgi:heme exporter protein D
MPEMHFSSFAELWTMNGHGPFVWAAYGIVTVVLVLLVNEPLRRRRRLLEQVRRRVSPEPGAR